MTSSPLHCGTDEDALLEDEEELELEDDELEELLNELSELLLLELTELLELELEPQRYGTLTQKFVPRMHSCLVQMPLEELELEEDEREELLMELEELLDDELELTSVWQVAEQPSLFVVLPSSHCSPC